MILLPVLTPPPEAVPELVFELDPPIDILHRSSKFPPPDAFGATAAFVPDAVGTARAELDGAMTLNDPVEACP